MAGEDEKSKKDPSKGFAGLSTLVSNIDTTQPSPDGAEPKKRQTNPPSSPRQPPPQAGPQPQQPASPAKQYQAPPEPTSGGSARKWILGIGAVIGVLWLIGEMDNSRPGRSAGGTAPIPSQAIPTLAETKPPVGQSLVFTSAQIRYCLAEEIRMNSAETVLDNYNDYDVDLFNAMVADYNSRCSNFRYRRGALESARREVEPHRSDLNAEGKSRFARSPSAGSVLPPTPARTAPDATVQSAQRQLNALGYVAGPADGLMGGSTRSAIEAFQRDRGVPITGTVDALLIAQLQQAPVRQAFEGPQSNGQVQLTSEEATSLEAACSTDKYLKGPAAFQACSDRQKAALAAGNRRPDLSSLTTSEQQSIEAACSQDKYLNGPASYNRCLIGQIAALSGEGTRHPDLSRLSSPERQSIDAACSQDKYLNGPAAYNRCLNRQLDELVRQGGRPDLSRLSVAERNSIESACSTDKYLNGPAAYNRCLVRQLGTLRN